MAILAAALAALLVVPPASAAKAKRVVQGAPIYVLDDGTFTSTRPAAAGAAAPRPAAVSPAPAAADGPAAPSAGERALVRGAGWTFLLLVLLAIAYLRRGGGAGGSFSLAGDAHAPGSTVRGRLQTSERPTSVEARLELYADGEDVPRRAVPVLVSDPERLPDGWRTLVEAVLPDDAIPPFEGGWALSIEATVAGRVVREGENVELLSFFLKDAGPFAPGSAVRGVLLTASRPTGLSAGLDLYRTGGEGGEPERRAPGRAGEPEQAAGGWRTVVEAVLPEDARRDLPGSWVLWAEGKAGSEDVAEEADVDVA